MSKMEPTLLKEKDNLAMMEDCELLRNILDHIADPIFVKDRNHRIIYGNKALSDMIGLPMEKYLNKNDYELFCKEEGDIFWERDDRVLNTGEVDWNEEKLTDSSGKTHILSTKKSRCHALGSEPVIVGVTRDITSEKEVERIKSDFLAMVSHELRTPLTSIYSALELLESGKICEMPDQAMSMLTIAYRNSQRLVSLVNEILDIEKIEGGSLTLDIKAIQLKVFLQSIIEDNTPYGEKYGVMYELEENLNDYHVLADYNRLSQVFTNLLSNAAKYSGKSQVVKISYSCNTENRICICVADNGIGIPEQFQPKVFDKFFQVEQSKSTPHSGVGLGLNITKKMVEAMKGAIYFESTLGEGTRFYVELDKASPQIGK